MEDAIPLVRANAVPLVRIVVRDPSRPRVDPHEPKVIVDPAIYREAEEQARRRRGGEAQRVARRLRTLIDPPRTR